jgi:ABC-type transport system involved in multi-copper enzyme maturation permease subunit
MLWLTYRQHRLELGALLLAALGGAAMILVLAQIASGLRLELGIDQCAIPFRDPGCGAKLDEFNRRTGGGMFRWPILGLYLLPAFVAAFLAAPLISREYERGTNRLAWTQGISRTAWLLWKIGLVLLVAVIAGLVIALIGGRTRELNIFAGVFAAFDYEGPAIVAYMAFAVAFGTLVSIVLRRSVVAMLASLIGFVAIRVFVGTVLRPNYLPPIRIATGTPPSDAWSLGFRQFTESGAEVPMERYSELMVQFGGAIAQQFRGNLNAYLAEHDVFVMQLYQPADRYWLFQSIEAAIFFGLALMCVLISLWLVRARPV